MTLVPDFEGFNEVVLDQSLLVLREVQSKATEATLWDRHQVLVDSGEKDMGLIFELGTRVTDIFLKCRAHRRSVGRRHRRRGELLPPSLGSLLRLQHSQEVPLSYIVEGMTKTTGFSYTVTEGPSWYSFGL